MLCLHKASPELFPHNRVIRDTFIHHQMGQWPELCSMGMVDMEEVVYVPQSFHILLSHVKKKANSVAIYDAQVGIWVQTWVWGLGIVGLCTFENL